MQILRLYFKIFWLFPFGMIVVGWIFWMFRTKMCVWMKIFKIVKFEIKKIFLWDTKILKWLFIITKWQFTKWHFGHIWIFHLDSNDCNPIVNAIYTIFGATILGEIKFNHVSFQMKLNKPTKYNANHILSQMRFE